MAEHGPSEHLITFAPELIAPLWTALETLGVVLDSESEAQVWIHTPKMPAGRPTSFNGALIADGHEMSLEVSGLGEPVKAYTTCKLIQVRLTAPPAACEAARQTMTDLLAAFDEAYRMECCGCDHFLGTRDVAWHHRELSVFELVALHAALEQHLVDWEQVGVGSPQSKQPVLTQAYDEQGNKVPVYSDVRYYLRREAAWMVLEITPLEQIFQLRATAVGVSSEAIEALLDAVVETVDRQAKYCARKMTAGGEELELERLYAWEELFVAPKVKELLRHEIECFFGRKELYQKMGLAYRRGLLLHGAPGAGKTLFGKILASTVEDCAFIWVTAADVSTARDVTYLFKLARSAGRAILFFEDLDFYASHRERHYHGGSPLGELLVQLDGMHSNDGLLVIATTNDLQAIEPALRDRPSRFDVTLEFAPAGVEVRVAHLSHLLCSSEVDPDDIRYVAHEAEGFTGAQLQELALVARRAAMGTSSGTVERPLLIAALAEARRFKSVPVGFGNNTEGDDERW